MTGPFVLDEYQACSGERAEQRGRRLKDPKGFAGAKAHILFWAFAARLKSCPVTKQRDIGRFKREPEQT